MKKKDLSPVAWTLLAGSGALALYLLLRPQEKPPIAMVPTVDPRFQPLAVANFLRSPYGR